MDLLYDNELIYGRLLIIEEPHLIERYNKALAAFGEKPTKLKKFDVDKTGFRTPTNSCTSSFPAIPAPSTPRRSRM
jgi:hypothetical protein